MEAKTGRSLGVSVWVASLPCVLACASSGDPSSSGNGGGGMGGAPTSANAGQTSSAGALSSGGSGTAGTPAGSPAQSGGGSGLAGSTSGGTSAASGSGSGGSTPSSGCGKAAGLMNGRASIDVAGAMREYILALPNNYDPSHAYKLIFGWHPLGGSAQQVASGGYYGLQKVAKDQAIFVSPEGLPFQGDSLGWGNKNGEDLAFLTAMLDLFRAQLCVDEERIFSTGFSFGGMMSFAVGCSSTSMMRAIAPMAGNTMVSGCEKGTRPVAMMGFHGTHDSVVDISGGQKGRDTFVQRNGCTMETMPSQPSWCDGLAQNYQPCSCVSYQGCMPGYPVIWCEYNADHMAAPTSGATLWSFFSQF